MGDKSRELAGQIRYYRDTQALSFRQIAEKLQISRDKVARLYAGEELKRKPRHFLLDPYRELILRWYSETPTLKSVQAWKRLREVSHSTLTETFRSRFFETFSNNLLSSKIGRA